MSQDLYPVPPTSSNPSLNQDLGPAEVLIIEDEELMAALVQRYIQHFNEEGDHQSLTHFRLDSGWKLLNSDLSHIKIAVVDLLLPQVTGADLIRHFRSHYPKMGLVPITGMATGPMRRQILEVLPEGCDILEKPLRKSSFLDAFKKAYEYSMGPGHKPKLVESPPSNPTEEIWSSAVASSIPTPQFKRKPKFNKAS